VGLLLHTDLLVETNGAGTTWPSLFADQARTDRVQSTCDLHPGGYTDPLAIVPVICASGRVRNGVLRSARPVPARYTLSKSPLRICRLAPLQDADLPAASTMSKSVAGYPSQK
jgi:hypothetical protein